MKVELSCEVCTTPFYVVPAIAARGAPHHIDYVKMNCSESNLITLCDVCNKKVNVNREKWTSYFQSIMKERVCLVG